MVAASFTWPTPNRVATHQRTWPTVWEPLEYSIFWDAWKTVWKVCILTTAFFFSLDCITVAPAASGLPRAWGGAELSSSTVNGTLLMQSEQTNLFSFSEVLWQTKTVFKDGVRNSRPCPERWKSNHYAKRTKESKAAQSSWGLFCRNSLSAWELYVGFFSCLLEIIFLPKECHGPTWLSWETT